MTLLGLTTILSGVSGLFIILFASWTLGVELSNEFQAYWGLFFALSGALDGISNEITRFISSNPNEHSREKDVPTLFLGTFYGGATAIIIASTATFWITLVTPSSSPIWGISILILGLFSYSFQAVLAGLLSGTRRWKMYAYLLIGDSAIRLILAFVAWQINASLHTFMLITIAGSFVWMFFIPTMTFSSSKNNLRQWIKPTLWTLFSSGSSSMLIAGFPALVQVSSFSKTIYSNTTLSALLLAVILTRAPVLVPLQKFNTVIIAQFANSGRQSTLMKAISVVFSIGILGSLLAGTIGPSIFQFITLGTDGFSISGYILSALTFGASCIGVIYITGAAALSERRVVSYAFGWFFATVISFALLFLPIPLDVSICLSLILGPLTGSIVHLKGLR